MKILITLFFNSELGGLHDNIRAVALESKKRGYDVYVSCRKGVFSEQLNADGIETIELIHEDVEQSVKNIISKTGTDIDIIHANPGISRNIAIQLHDDYNIPVIFHVHGGWVNAVEEYIDKLSSVFTVSESVRQKVIERTDGNAHKIHVIPNYSDYTFEQSQLQTDRAYKVVSLITRLEKDKSKVIEEVEKLLHYMKRTDQKIHFNIIGDGSLRTSFIAHMKNEIQNNNVKINDIGWVSDKAQLKTYMAESDFIIGPGRVAIDAFTLRIPVIVVGSRNYHGLITENNWQHFSGANFGGYGSRQKGEGDIEADFHSLLTDKDTYKKTVDIGSKVVDLFFNKENTLEKMFGIYEIVGWKNKKEQ